MGQSVTRLRPATTINEYGDIVHTGAYDELELDGCGLAPRVEGEQNDGGRQGVAVGWDLYAPHGVDVEPTDLIRSADGEVYRVDGEPADWRHMMTDWRAGTVVSLARYEG